MTLQISATQQVDTAMVCKYGQGVVRGYAIGRAHVLGAANLDIPKRAIDKQYIAAEQQRLQLALQRAIAEVDALIQNLPEDAPKEMAALLGVHSLLLSDPSLYEQTSRVIAERANNAEWALYIQMQQLQTQFAAMSDAYLRERASDIRQVIERVLHLLMGESQSQQNTSHTHAHANADAQPRILVARDIAPADMLSLRNEAFAAFLTDLGGPTSHTAIVARSLNVPAVVGLGTFRALVEDGDVLIVDGFGGEVIVNPSPEVLAEYQKKQDDYSAARAKLESLRDAPAITLDGFTVDLHANIELPEEADAAYAAGAAGIGLFRSEFLFMGRQTLPTEAEQFEAYKYVLETMQGLPVTIRTLDIGADKVLDGEQVVATNPALGLRAVRYCLAHPEVFQTQLRALLRASVYGSLRILIPMVSTMAEVVAVKQALAQAQNSLRRQNIAYAENIQLGAMIEVPAAAIAIEPFAANLDFLSIGTNDLIQYVMAVDRGDAEVADLYDPLHPAVLRLIAHTINAGDRFDIPVSICGEVAGDSTLTRLLLGLGVKSLSMHPAQLLDVKREIIMAHSQALQNKVAATLNRADRLDLVSLQ